MPEGLNPNLITAGGLKVIGEAHIPGLGVTAKEPINRAFSNP